MSNGMGFKKGPWDDLTHHLAPTKEIFDFTEYAIRTCLIIPAEHQNDKLMNLKIANDTAPKVIFRVETDDQIILTETTVGCFLDVAERIKAALAPPVEAPAA